ncbi:MAG: hypothetical protein Roseis2KO_03450 [Roseivirga sp.]
MFVTFDAQSQDHWCWTCNPATNGYVRIGVNAPYTTKQLYVRANGSDNIAYFENISPFGNGVIISAPEDPLRVGGLNNPFGNLMIVKGDGRVGIGTTSPLSGYKLDVNGRVNMDGFYSTATNNYINGNLTVYGYVSDWSDRRFKKNIREEFSEYQKLYDLKIYEYQYKDRDDRQSFGVMAQELTEVFPDLVLGNEEDGYSVRYTSMIPLLIRAVQDQKQTIESLKEELTELKAKITENDELAEVLGIEGERMTIFPNPSSSVANISLKGNTRGDISLEVVNLNGEVVQRVAANGSKSAEINTSEMLKGVYFVRYMRDGKVIETKRLLIEK